VTGVRRRTIKSGPTRQALLETAGEVFAAVGFEGASGRDICERAGANVAAINYYFGGIEGLHQAVVEEAQARVVGLAPVLELVGSTGTAEWRLTRLFQLLLETGLDNAGMTAWPMKVLAREALGKSDHLDKLRETDLVPKLRVVRGLLAEFMELPEGHGAATDACLAYLSVSVMLHMADHEAIRRAFPSQGDLSNGSIVAHFTEFMLGGIKRLSELAKLQEEAASDGPVNRVAIQ
jgi:AcrR family transcriptional regulator